MSAFQRMAEFIGERMRMSHVYQPVMLSVLLKSGGRASTRMIAKAILEHDESQIEYYEKIVRNMPGRVLAGHGIVQRDGAEFVLPAASELQATEVDRLLAMADRKISDYRGRRGTRIWSHRKGGAGYVPGSVRYEVLKRARFRCELCGIPADERALEVDHIEPRSKGGQDEIDNFQALCYSCNATKRDRDDTDFRGIRETYRHRLHGCIFCDPEVTRVLYHSELAVGFEDKFPVTPGHLLFVPKRHVETYFDLTRPELNAIDRLMRQAREELQKRDPSIGGFNLGANCGASAGQTVMHCHIHLIPRRDGDMADPRGGVRHVIPEKANYLTGRSGF
jgi:ATP adenylyltransferase